jgi:hypothetical protein
LIFHYFLYLRSLIPYSPFFSNDLKKVQREKQTEAEEELQATLQGVSQAVHVLNNRYACSLSLTNPGA